MNVQRILLFAFLLVYKTGLAQLQSPEAFLGYRLGTRFTAQHRIVEYFKHVAAEAKSGMLLKQYGETFEHRPLFLAYISSAENITNLEQIRQNNLRLAGVGNGKMQSPVKEMAIVWLSYNVHGDEPSSSEAAMLTLYALVNPNETQYKPFLENTVVIIDPCLNPDGRDRYVNWFTGSMGNTANTDLDSREHHQPWPGGRTNHYNFDLNRDWCWQTQIESRQRAIEYHRWLPQVHVDFHEQGINSPYYFAPAAQPYHDVITPWQREFQVLIGKNHARYFDRNNWLYFTREIFDLLYPSYGDTYPLFNGSIGMTYEQAGGPAGGLSVKNAEGDTLNLADRILHHHITGLSTIEVSSKNAPRLTREFNKFFSDAAAGKIGDYKTYIVKVREGDDQNLKALKLLLDRNMIKYGTGSGSGRGFHYSSRKEEDFTISPSDLVISSSQPQAALLKVLFEPQTKLVDSATYDITAWALPYAYGLDAFASKSRVSVTASVASNVITNSATNSFGYLIGWEGVASARVLTALQKKGIRVRFAETAFDINGRKYDRGTLIVLQNGNTAFGNNLGSIVARIADTNQVLMQPVSSGMVDKGFDFGSYYVHPLPSQRIAMLTGDGVNANAAGEIWFFLDQELQHSVSLINAEDFGRTNWSNYNVLIIPDGRYSFLENKSNAEKFKNWIEDGGRVLALQNGAAQLSKQEWSSVRVRNMTDSAAGEGNQYDLLQSFDKRERTALTRNTPGSIYKVEIDNTHPLMFGYEEEYYSLKLDNTVFDFIKEGGWNTGVVKKDNLISGYVGYRLNTKLKDGLLFGVQELGAGSITYFAEDVLFRNFWEAGKLMFCNALFFVGR